MTLLLVALAGGIGSAARFAVDTLLARHNRFRMPLGTLVVNVTGSLALGVLAGWVTHEQVGGVVAADVAAVVGTGFCGGYTTFSTTSVEAVRLWLGDGPTLGVGYAVTTLLGSVGAAMLGLALGSLLG